MTEEYVSLGISPESTPDWGIQEALREFLQNYLDNTEESQHHYEDGVLTLLNQNTVIEKASLLVGKSSKRGCTESRGRHGDGLCSALAVLVREGISHSITNGAELWTVESHYCPTFKDDIIRLVISPTPDEGCFEVKIHITEEDYEEMVTRCLPFQENLDIFPTEQGDILLDEAMKGYIFVGGMFVCVDNNLSKGYNFKPNQLKLDRDRSLARTWDIISITDNMIAEMSNSEEHVDTVVDMVTSNCQDVTHLTWSSNSVSDEVVEKLHDNFVALNGNDAVVAESFDEQTQLRNSGYKKVVFTGNSVAAQLIKRSTNYRVLANPVVTKDMGDYLQEYLDKYEAEMSTEMFNDFEDMSIKLKSL